LSCVDRLDVNAIFLMENLMGAKYEFTLDIRFMIWRMHAILLVAFAM
jgi:hypothetical protein